MKKLFYSIPIVLVLLLAVPVTAFAAPLDDGKVVLGSHYVLESGETLDGDLVVLGGIAELMEDSTVYGSVFVMGGSLEADGYIDGDLAVMGGNVDLGPNAVVDGDVVTLGGNVDPGLAIVKGTITSEQVFDFPMNFDSNRDYGFPTQFGGFQGFQGFQGFGMSMGTRILAYFFQAFLLAALAALVVVFIPEHTKRVASTLAEQTWISGGIGILTMIVAPILIFFLFITICFAVIGFLGVFILVVAGVFGWIAMGMEVGDRLAKALEREWQPVLSASAGTFVVTLVLMGIGGFVPCIGWLAPFLVGAAGLGAVILTRFGTREYIPGGAEAESAKPPARKTTKAS
ncbi:MAG: hypothetical protein ACERKX_00220 [Anaerolineales bacterium]